jgi:hypothetical protein
MQVGATPKCQAVHSGAGAQTCSGRGVQKAERRRAAGRRNGPEAVTEQETGMEPGRQTSERSDLPASWLCRSLATQTHFCRQTPEQRAASRNRNRSPSIRRGHTDERTVQARFHCLHSAQEFRSSTCLRFARSNPQLTPLRQRKLDRFPRFRRTGWHGYSPSR